MEITQCLNKHCTGFINFYGIANSRSHWINNFGMIYYDYRCGLSRCLHKHCTGFFGILKVCKQTGIIIVILTVHLSYKTANCVIVVIPTDTEVMVNQSTFLNCSTTITSQEVAWYRYRVGDPYRRHDVYDAGIIDKNYRDRFYIDGDKTKGVYNLVIRRVLEEDAGKYECQDNGGIGDKKSAELVVLDSKGPVCQLNTPAERIVGPNDCGIEPTTLEFSCVVKFNGNNSPQLEWSMERGKEEKKFPPSSSSSNFSVNEATCNLTVKAELQMNESSIVCKTTGSTSHRCAVDDIKVLYAFNNREGVAKTLNDQVTCVANSNQPCTYKWKWVELKNDITIDRDPELKVEREGWYRCEAECQFGTKICHLVAMVIHVFPPVKRDVVPLLETITAFVVLQFVGLSFVTFIIYRIYRKRTTNYDRVQSASEQIESLLQRNERGRVPIAEESSKRTTTF